MNKINYLVFPIILLSQNALAVNSQYPCNQIIFSALDVKHINSVSVCLSNNQISYTYSKLNSNKNDLDILVEKRNAGWDYYVTKAANKMIFGSMTIQNGQYIYKMTSGKDKKGVVRAFMTVYKGKTPLTVIPLDPRTVINQISPLLKNHGIPSFEDKQNEHKKRNPTNNFYFS